MNTGMQTSLKVPHLTVKTTAGTPATSTRRGRGVLYWTIITIFIMNSVTCYCVPLQVGVNIVHGVVAIWRRYPNYWPVIRGTHRSILDSPHKASVIRGLNIFFVVILILFNKDPMICYTMALMWRHCDVAAVSRKPCTVWFCCNVEIWQLTSNFIRYFILGIIAYLWWD